MINKTNTYKTIVSLNYYARMLKIPGKGKKTILESPAVEPLAGKTFDKLTDIEKFDVLLSFLKIEKKQVYLIDDIATGLPTNLAIQLKDCMDNLAQKGSLVIYLTSTTNTGEDVALEEHYFYEGISWIYFCEGNRRKMKYRSKSEQD